MTTAVNSTPRLGNITLSRGASTPYQIPANMGGPYPLDATCYVQFIDTNGDDVGTPIAGAVFADRLQWLFNPVDVDQVKRGMNFEAFLVIDDSTKYKLRYGKVVRREAAFEYSVVSKTSALLYSDDFTGRTGQAGNQYAPVSGNSTIHNNQLLGTPNGLAVNIGLLFSLSSVRVNRSLNSDSVRMQVTMISQGAGKTTVGFCANTGLTSGIGVTFDAGLSGDKTHVAKILSPNNVEFLGTEHDAQIATGNIYILDYNDDTKTFQCFQGSDIADPILTWVDEDNEIVHGQGYRYPFFMWNASLLATGPQVQKWRAQDYVGA